MPNSILDDPLDFRKFPNPIGYFQRCLLGFGFMLIIWLVIWYQVLDIRPNHIFQNERAANITFVGSLFWFAANLIVFRVLIFRLPAIKRWQTSASNYKQEWQIQAAYVLFPAVVSCIIGGMIYNGLLLISDPPTGQLLYLAYVIHALIWWFHIRSQHLDILKKANKPS